MANTIGPKETETERERERERAKRTRQSSPFTSSFRARRWRNLKTPACHYSTISIALSKKFSSFSIRFWDFRYQSFRAIYEFLGTNSIYPFDHFVQIMHFFFGVKFEFYVGGYCIIWDTHLEFISSLVCIYIFFSICGVQIELGSLSLVFSVDIWCCFGFLIHVMAY